LLYGSFFNSFHLDLELCSMQPCSTLLYGRMGNGIVTYQLMKMVAGAINPGRPVANLYVSFIPRGQ
jgi:hypothetical protein